jgi:Galactose oxidase, central domain/Kelch motif
MRNGDRTRRRYVFCSMVRSAGVYVVILLAALAIPAAALAAKPAGRLQVTPRTVKFPNLVVVKPESSSFIVKNVGNAPLSGSVGAASGLVFQATSGGGPFNLDPGATVTVDVQFDPFKPGRYKGTVLVRAGRAKKVVALSGIVAPSPSGKVVIIGGAINPQHITKTTEIYDPLKGSFTMGPPMSDSRSTATADYLDPSIVSGGQAGKIFVAGGQDDLDNVLGSTLLYSPVGKPFSKGPSSVLPCGFAEHDSTFFTGGPLKGDVLLTGGQDDSFFDPFSGIECDPTGTFSAFPVLNFWQLYDPVAGTFVNTGGMNEPRSEHTATLIHCNGCTRDNFVLVTGGFEDNEQIETPAATAELFDPSARTFTCVGGAASGGGCNPTMSVPRWDHAATSLPDGTILITGGTTVPQSQAGSVSADIYDPVANAISPTANMKVPREGHTATLIEGCDCPADGMVLIAGGQLDDAGNQEPTATAELYDPSTGTFTLTGSMSSPRSAHTATLLVGPFAGWVLITGGYAKNGATPLKSAELYNPFTGTFIRTGSMHIGRNEHTATLIPPD